nr:hypothetical protein [Salmonella enterica]
MSQPSTLPASFCRRVRSPSASRAISSSFSGCACGSSARASSPGVCAVACCQALTC